jgi:predicted NAD/FAD-binding protein
LTFWAEQGINFTFWIKRAQFCRNFLEDFICGMTAGILSSVPAFFLIPRDLLEYQP